MNRRTFIVGLCLTAGSLELTRLSDSDAEAATTSLTVRVTEGQDLAGVLAGAGYNLVFDTDYSDVVMAVVGRNKSLRARPLYERKTHLVAYLNGVPINAGVHLSRSVTLASRLANPGDKLVIQRESFNKNRRNKGLRAEPPL